MESISLSYFVDFVLTSGTSKLTSVKQLKQGRDERFSDFYRPVREAIVDMHEKGLDSQVLDDLLTSLVDPREKRIFPKVVSGYKKFLRQSKTTWFEPPMRDYPLGPISVRVNPEVGLLIDGRPHAIKLYFRGDPLSPQRVMVINQLLSNALASTWPGTVFSVLDVRRAKLYPHRPKSEVGHLLRAEAASLSSLYSAI
ncbi:MAG: hypothetical protein R3B70_47910 [Polyangiaceae bacterium]